MDNFIEKFWEIVNEQYDYRDMLTFDEIQKIFDEVNLRIIIEKNGWTEVR